MELYNTACVVQLCYCCCLFTQFFLFLQHVILSALEFAEMAVPEVAVLYTTATVVTAVGHLKVHRWQSLRWQSCTRQPRWSRQWDT